MLFLPCRAAVVPPEPGITPPGSSATVGQIGSYWRKLNPARQALLVLA
jgi:hypothetical protein